MIQKMTLKFVGVVPLLMHNIRLANPLDEIAQAMKEITSKKKKTEADLIELSRLEFMGGLYYDEATGPYIPGELVEAAFSRAGAAIRKKGAFVGGITVEDAPLVYNGPRDPDELWKLPIYRDVRGVRVGQSRVMRCRPKFPKWEADVHITYDDGLLTDRDVRRAAEEIGARIGLGDFRPKFGRFTVS